VPEIVQAHVRQTAATSQLYEPTGRAVRSPWFRKIGRVAEDEGRIIRLETELGGTIHHALPVRRQQCNGRGVERHRASRVRLCVLLDRAFGPDHDPS
jgi:hypothetical protein